MSIIAKSIIKILRNFLIILFRLIILIGIIVIITSIWHLFHNRKASFISIIPIIISLVSVYYVSRNYKRNKYSDRASFHIIQNLWDPDKPRFSLTNESTKKLRTIPSHTYIMLIPSKIHFRIESQGEMYGFYFLVLSPFSYQVIYKQTDYLQTIGALETSYLPSNFYTKKGSRNNIFGKILKKNHKDHSYMQVETLPMILIATKLDYQYLNSSKINTTRFITTPIQKIPLSEFDLKNIFEYVHDNANLEIRPKKGESIYKTANNSITNLCLHNMHSDSYNSATFLGIKKGRHYGKVLKALSNVITPIDPMTRFSNDKYRD